MYRISNNEVDYILDDIKRRGVELEDLQFNLLDHVCCIIEQEKPDGTDFYKFYEDIIVRFYEKELKEIEVETNNLLTFKNYYAMKRIMKIMGLLTALMMLVGAIFKLMHWQGAGVIMISGFVLFAVVFLPLLVVLKSKDSVELKDKLLFAFGTLIGIAASAGVMFKLMHWPLANILMFSSQALFILVYIPMYFILKIRNPGEKFNVMMNSILMLGAGALIFSLMSVSSSNGIDQSLYAIDSFLNKNVTELVASNQRYYNNLDDSGEDKVRAKHELSQQLMQEISDINTFLISQVEGVHIDQARTMKVKDLRNPKNTFVVNGFSGGSYEYSLKKLVAKVDEYNNKVGNLIGKPIDLNSVQLTRTNIALFIHQMTQIQLQIAVNEQSLFMEENNLTVLK